MRNVVMKGSRFKTCPSNARLAGWMQFWKFWIPGSLELNLGSPQPRCPVRLFLPFACISLDEELGTEWPTVTLDHEPGHVRVIQS